MRTIIQYTSGIFFLATSATSFATQDCLISREVLGGDEFKVTVERFTYKDSLKHIIVIPPTGGSNLIDRSYAKSLCAAGFNAHILEHWTGDDERNLDFGIHQRLYSRVQAAISMVIDNLHGATYVGVLGTSLGGLFAAQAMGLHEKLKGAFVIVGGADIASIIGNSDQEAMVNLFHERQKLYAVEDRNKYIETLRAQIAYEPLKLAAKFEGKDLGMVIGTADTTVPFANQEKLKKLWRPKTVIEYSNNHFLSIIRAWLFDSSRMVNFFQESALGKK